MVNDNTLWALGANKELWYSFDQGTTWSEVDVSSLSNWLNGLWGPTSVWKIYVGVADDGTYYYDGTWHLEDANGPWWYATQSRPESQTIWCSDDDSIVCAAGWSSSYNNVIRTRPGLPGTSWVTEFDDGAGNGYFNDIHGTPDGSAVFAIRSYLGSGNDDVELLKRNSNGTWSSVASITDGNSWRWQQVRVISENEVWITGGYFVGGSDLVGRIWKWNGSSLSVEYEDTDIRSNGIVGLWMAKDGSEGWALFQVTGPSSESDYYLYYNGSTWSVDQGVQYGTSTSDITQRDDVPSSAIALIANGRYRKYDGSDWDNTYSYSGSNNDIWDETSSALGLILRYIEYSPSLPLSSLEWSFEVADYVIPWIENESPTGINVNSNTLIDVDILDDYSGVDINSIDAYVNGIKAFEGPNTFISPYDGTSSTILGTIVDGYDGYHLTIEKTSDFGIGDDVLVRIVAYDNYGNFVDTDWSFKISGDGTPPWLKNQSPTGSGVAPGSIISVDILDDYSGVDINSIDAYVNGIKAFEGPNTFISPYDGTFSTITPTFIDGYDGYYLLLDNVSNFDSGELYTVRIVASDLDENLLDDNWQFRVIDYNAPWIQDEFPIGQYASKDTIISANILDDYSGVDINKIDAYVNGTLVFSGPNTFYSPFDISSTITDVVVDGYDGYFLSLDSSTDLDSYGIYNIRIIAYDLHNNYIDYTWQFQVLDYVAPWLENNSPTSGASINTLVSTDILDDASGVLQSSLDAYMDGVLIFSGPDIFISPYDGLSSIISSTTYGGFDGYNLVIDNTNEYISGSSHTLRITGRDAYGNDFDESFSFNITIIPEVLSIKSSLYEITLDVDFNVDMLDNNELRNPANYVFNNGMYARKVDVLSNTSIRLWVELFYGRDDFALLSINQKVKNIDGFSFNTSMDAYNIAPFKSDATFTNYNAMVRTWHDSYIIDSDSQRIYLGGTKGIDIFRKHTSTIFYRWGQIFDEYGIDAMTVYNYPTDIEITDTTPPILVDVFPVPSYFATANTHISFKVRDLETAVEITSLRIYVEGNLVFSGGYGGWQNYWSGSIDVEHHQLSIEIWQDSLFDLASIVTVRVVAQDLMENELDTSFNFNIIVSIDGFGGSPFGGFPFGGV